MTRHGEIMSTDEVRSMIEDADPQDGWIAYEEVLYHICRHEWVVWCGLVCSAPAFASLVVSSFPS